MADLLNQLLDLWGEKKEHFSFSLIDPHSSIHYQENKEFNVASSYKVFVLGELLRQAEHDQQSLSKKMVLNDEVRIFDSSFTETIPNGTELTILELAKAMMGYSDNTATEMIQSCIGTDQIMSLLESHGITQTRFPEKLKSLMDITSAMTSIDQSVASTLFQGELGILSTSKDLAKFYQLLWSKSIIKNKESMNQLKDILAIEDERQSIIWPEGVKCYRKSGNIDLDYYYGFSLAGVIQKEESFVPFALCLNFNHEEEIQDMLAMFKKSFSLIKESILVMLV